MSTPDNILSPEVLEFAQMMQSIIDKHAPVKGESWRKESPQILEQLMVNELTEYFESTKLNPSLTEIIDIANFLLFIYHVRKNNNQLEKPNLIKELYG